MTSTMGDLQTMRSPGEGHKVLMSVLLGIRAYVYARRVEGPD